MTRMEATRKARNLTQAELAQRAQMSQPDISAIETGRVQPWPGHAKRLARVLKLKPEELTEAVA